MKMSLHIAAQLGHQGSVKELLKGDLDINPVDDNGRTPLLCATKKGHKGIVKLLLEDRSNPNLPDKDGLTPLLYAAAFGYEEVVMLLLQEDGVDPNIPDNNNQAPLSHAAEKRHKEVVRLFLQKDDIDPNLSDNNRRTPLWYAAKKGYKEVVKLLLQKDGIDPNFQDDSNRTPLSYAAACGYEAVVRLLLQKNGIDPNLRDSNGRIALIWAAENAHRAVVWILADSRSSSGRTVLSWAAENGHTAVVQLLLENDNINPNSKDNGGQTPLSRALENGHEAVMKLLARRDSVTLHMLVQEGKQNWARLLLDAEYDINTRDSRRRTPLHIAVLYRQTEIARELVSRGANVNSEDTDGMTPLRLAIQHKDLRSVELLLQHRAQVKGIMANEWLDAYGKKALGTRVELLEEPGEEKRIGFAEGISVETPAEPGREKRLFVFSDCPDWLSRLAPNSGDTSGSQIFHEERKVHDTYNIVSVAVRFPAGRDPGNRRHSDTSNWGICAIAWTTIPPTKLKDGPYWKSVEHFSMLPYGWIPDDGADFFREFVLYLKERWLRLCGLAEEHLSKRRLDQLREKGDSPRLIHHLAEDAMEWARLRSILRDQVRTTRDFAAEHIRRYNADKSTKVQEAIDSFSDEVGDRLNQLDQTVKDLLQFEFAWVSINEAHRSTSIATSMKRLSWITFIFLPAMFASSLFGMNVDILATNPDWRWYILFGVGTLTFTVMGWLLFKYGQIEGWIERHIGTRLERWGKTVARDIQRLTSEQALPTSEQVKL